jgi:osmotically-inducible protein OsmY
MKNDMQLQHDVLDELDHDAAIEAGSIGVEVHHGVVKLAGLRNNPEVNRRAAQDAHRVAGVTDVILDMGVDEPAL